MTKKVNDIKLLSFMNACENEDEFYDKIVDLTRDGAIKWRVNSLAKNENLYDSSFIASFEGKKSYASIRAEKFYNSLLFIVTVGDESNYSDGCFSIYKDWKKNEFFIEMIIHGIMQSDIPKTEFENAKDILCKCLKRWF